MALRGPGILARSLSQLGPLTIHGFAEAFARASSGCEYFLAFLLFLAVYAKSRCRTGQKAIMSDFLSAFIAISKGALVDAF